MSANEPAFPTTTKDSVQGVEFIDYIPGLSKREYFAAKAMQGLISNSSLDPMRSDELAHDALHYADALIEALNK